jgi:hypothetical protein
MKQNGDRATCRQCGCSASLSLPHHRVYARVAVSKIHGVGVVAIRRIKKGTPVFHGDDAAFQWVPMRTVRRANLPTRIAQLYEDFGVQFNGYYGCPISFNRLTPACYVNNSVTPNLAFSKARGFYALRDIEVDEELTADYRKFAELYR